MRKKFTMLLASLFAFAVVVKAQTPITAVDQLENNKVYTIVPKDQGRGAMYATSTSTLLDACGGTLNGAKNPSITIDPTSADQQFALYKHEGAIYLYSVGAGKFVSDVQDKLFPLVEQPGHAVAVVPSDVDGYFTIKVKGTEYINVSTGWSAGCVGGWNSSDDGNRLQITEVSEMPAVTLERLAEIFNSQVDLTIKYTFGGEEVSSITNKLYSGEEYTIPALDYTIVSSYKIGDAEATEGATIVVPATPSTVTVELEANFPFAVSTDYENAIWYAMQIRGNKYVVRSESAPYSNTTTTPTTEDALWAFVGDPFNGIQVLNKAAGAGYTLGYDEIATEKNIYMKEGTTTWTIQKGNGGFVLCQDASKNEYIHDYGSKLQYWVDGGAKTDVGSAFVVTSEADMISLATTAKNNLSSKLDVYAEASYYTYPNAAVAEAKATLQGVATPTDFLTALNAKATVESVQAALNTAGKSGAPAAGDFIILKNKAKNEYMTTMDSGDEVHRTSNKNNPKALWQVVAGDDSKVKLYNVESEKYLGALSQSAKVLMVEEANAAQFTFSNVADAYAAFTSGGGSHTYAHMDGWYDRVVGWEAAADASQWIVTNVRPLSVIYKYNDGVLSETTEYVEYGTVYTVSSSYDFTKVSACTKNEEALEAVDGVFSFEVTEATTLTVELADDLPFKTTTITEGQFAANTEWYVVRQHSSQGYTETWKYDETNGVTTEATTDYTEHHLWCFVGSKDDLKIYNKVAGSGMSLTNTDPASMAAENAAVWKMVKSAAEATFAGKGPFCLQKGNDASYLNKQSGKLKYWESRDEGSTIMVIPFQPLSIKYMFKGEELTDLSVNKLVESGSTYTITNPYANKYVNVTCAVNGNRVEAVDGQWSVNVTEATNVIVTITEELPFKTSKDFATANWQYLQINSESWKYVRNFVAEGDANTYSNTTDVAALGDNAQWAFVGDALNGFKILNKAAGDGYTLSFDGEMGNGIAAYMKQEEKTWTIEKGNGGFVIRQGATECLNDFGGKLKVWNADASPSGTGSAFRTISASVADLADLCFPGVFTLQAERSPLLYDASANVADANKLSSGMASGIAANGNDANQQFLISESETDGLYYLYSVGAAKFVDAELNFTDCPEPVLAFEPNAGNPVFPWFVKIGGKYVAPGSGGTEGNKIHHLASVSNDDGKRYRIEKVGEDMSLAQSVALTIQYAEGLIKEASQLSNSKVYAVFTYDRGAWYHNGDDALWSTGKTAKPDDAAENADHFAFLTVNGKIYLYSVGAGKFIVKSEAQHGGKYYAAYSDTPAQTVELLAATNGSWFPVVVKLNAPSAPSQLAISNSYAYPVIMYDNLSDTGNQVRLEEIGTLDLSAVVAQIEAYQLDEEAKGGLQTLITEATTKNAYLENASLTAAITAAQAALDKVGATYDELMTAKENLAAALNSALYVTEANGFSNDYVYTFVTLRGWVGADENSDNLIGTVNSKVNPAPTPSDDNTMFQWAVYKSTREHYYMYNIGKGMFMGIPTGEPIPFANTPQGMDLTFKRHNNDNAKWADYPIMFSPDNKGAVSQNGTAGLFYWSGGWNTTNDDGSNHKVTVVGKIDEGTLSTIAAAVELYETQGVAVQALDAAIAAAQAKVDGIGNGLGYYSTTEADAAATLAAIVEFKNAITGETTVATIEAQTAAANALVETFSVNLPKAGKFYRIKNNGETGYLSGDHATSGRTHFVDGIENSASSIFYFDGTKLLAYTTGLYLAKGTNEAMVHYTQTVGENAGTTFAFSASPVVGKLLITFNNGNRSFYSAGLGQTDAAGSGQTGNNYRFTVEEVDVLPVTVSSVGYATLYAPVALEIPEGVTAYIGVKEGNYLTLTDITEVVDNGIIPANTGVILESQFDEGAEKTAKTFNFAVEDDVDPIEASNLLTGKYPKSAKNADKKVYTLQNGDNGVGFYLFNGYRDENDKEGTKTYINGFRAWVEIAEPQAAQALAFRFRGKTTTDMEMPMTNGQQPAAIYDLTGRRIEKIVEKGIYIVNGKKVVIK